MTTATRAISTLIVDDEKLAREELNFLLRDYPDIEILATAENGIEAVRLIEDLEPDLVFLDVNMPGLDGMGVIRTLREKDIPLPHFVLATAYDQYAVEAFRLDALDYVLKPIEKERLEETLDRARRVVAEKGPPADATEAALPRPSSPTPMRTKLLVRAQNRNLIVDAQDMIYATIEDGVISVVTTSIEGMLNYRTLEELQSNLDPDHFWRAHRSYIVNIDRIKEVIPWFNSSFQIKMTDKKETEIPVSRVQTKRLRNLFRL
ncbi:DNA-binding response regulator [Bryobacterales bacterium F-183]|nr:DNA-binding response regulator [Bryobacterales bacterium F-183]